ncbi:MAG: HupE/UreJ family protein [Gammaproteobacteria bacterium]|nr:HupE/UreJ family protein [Gammaproteobacteria bacterium]
MLIKILLLIAGLACTPIAHADVVKPALTEINLFADGRVEIEIRTSLEALLTGIDGRYRNTQDAPGSERYDLFRQQSSTALAETFLAFHETLVRGVELTADEVPVSLKIASIEIPEPGYTKVPRTSTILLSGKIESNHEYLRWYYPGRFGDHAVRVKLTDEAREFWYWSDYQWIRQDRISDPFPLNGLIQKTTWFDLLSTYAEAGYLHILPLGLDHILFILGLFLMSRKLRPLLWQVTMFTLAHSITLSLSTLGIFDLPSSLVEPLIALSIAYVAIENIWHQKLSSTRLWVVFGFGLLHGLGFATMLAEFGLPDNGFLLALLGFNLGVEAGQISVLLMAWLVIGFWFRQWVGYRQWIVIPASSIIAFVGLIWFWQRLSLT